MAVAAGILKLLGFLALLVLGIFLLHIVLLLLIPFHYQLGGCFQGGKGKAEAGIKWLFGYLRTDAALSEEGLLKICCRVLGISVWTFEKQLPLPGSDKEHPTAADAVVSAVHAEDKENIESTKNADDIRNTESTESSESLEISEISEISDGAVRSDYTEKTEGTERTENAESAGDSESTASTDCKDCKDCKESVRTADSTEITNCTGNRGLSEKKLSGVKLSAEAVFHKLAEWKDFFTVPEHKKVLCWILGKLKKVLLELKPHGGSGMLCFGTGDPYDTGQLLEVLAFLFPFYGSWLEIVPAFDEKTFSASADIQGRFRLWILLLAALQLYFSRDVKKLITEFREVASHG